MNNDLISREALKKAMTDYEEECGDIIPKKYFDFIDNAPTVEPLERIGSICEENCGYRPKGEWKVDDKIYCSECGASICDFVPNPTDAVVIILENKFCFNCGADMRKGGAV